MPLDWLATSTRFPPVRLIAQKREWNTNQARYLKTPGVLQHTAECSEYLGSLIRLPLRGAQQRSAAAPQAARRA